MAKILVVDDEAIITMQLEERLSAMGYTVAGMAASGEDAVDKARRLRPDLVLMDIVMPGKMNGIEAARIIAQELDIPVVFVTSYADDAIIEKAKSVRPYGYIVKPFNELEIKAAIEVALFRKATEQEEQKLRKSAQEKISPGMEPNRQRMACLSRSAGNKNRTFKRYLHRHRSLPLHRPGRKRTNIQICAGRGYKKRRTQSVCLFPVNSPEILPKRDPEKGTFHPPDKKKRSLYPAASP